MAWACRLLAEFRYTWRRRVPSDQRRCAHIPCTLLPDLGELHSLAAGHMRQLVEGTRSASAAAVAAAAALDQEDRAKARARQQQQAKVCAAGITSRQHLA